MALPSSGQISISQIRSELGTSNGSLRYLSSLAGFSTPDAMSDFWGYSPAVTLYIDYVVPSYAGCYNYYTFTALTSAVVNTNVYVTIYWYGDLGGYMVSSPVIYSGNDCGYTDTYSGGGINCWGENISYVNVSISPSSSGNQSYVVGSQLPSYYSCA